MADVKTLIDQAWAELLQTTASGKWYSQNLGAPGHWFNARKLLEQARATVGSAVTGVTIDAAQKPSLRAVVSPVGAVATTFQWQRCDSSGGSCLNIPGATSSTYTLTSADAGSSIRVVADGVTSPAWNASVTPPPPGGATLYVKDWEDGVIDSQGWGHQSLGVTPETTNAQTQGNGIARGPISITTTNPGKGTRSGHFSLPPRDPNIYRSTACQVLHDRKPDMNTHAYYSLAFKLNSAGGGFYIPSEQPSTLCSTNYQQPTGQWMVGAMSIPHTPGAANLSLFGLISGGDGTSGTYPYYSGQPVGGGYGPRPAGMPGPLYLVIPGQVQYDVWYQVITHFYYTTGMAGIHEGWIKKKGDASFVQKYSVKGGQNSFFTNASGSIVNLNPCIGFPTALWGNGWTVEALNANTPVTNDKFGLYAASSLQERSVDFDCFSRCSDFNTAAAQF